MNVVFKVYWNNPIEMVAEAGTQQLTFEVPLGAIISNPSGGGKASYPSFTGNADKVLTVNATEDDVEWKTPVTQVYVDAQDSLLQDQINLKADAIAVNQVLSTKADLIGGLIPASQLPSYVDDVLSFPDLASFPVVGEGGKIYVAEDVNKTYRWGGSSYVEIGGGGVALGETSSTAYRGDRGKIAYDHSLSQGNPHNTTTSEITEGSKLFFTAERVRQTALDGFSAATATPITAADNVLQALGKAQAQLNVHSIVQVNADTVATIHSGIIEHNLKFIKKDGFLFLTGGFTHDVVIGGSETLITITDSEFLIKPYVTGIHVASQNLLLTGTAGSHSAVLHISGTEQAVQRIWSSSNLSTTTPRKTINGVWCLGSLY